MHLFVSDGPPFVQDNKAVKAASEAYGNTEVHCREIFTNTDDVAIKYHVGPAPKNGARGVPNAEARAYSSCYKLDEPDPSRFLNVHFTATASSKGWSATPVLRITVKDREWNGPPGDNFVTAWVPGLCRGGDVSPGRRDSDGGYLVFMRNVGEKDSESVDSAFFKWYIVTVLLPFIEMLRVEEFGHLGWKPGDDLLPGMGAAACSDGARAPVKCADRGGTPLFMCAASAFTFQVEPCWYFCRTAVGCVLLFQTSPFNRPCYPERCLSACANYQRTRAQAPEHRKLSGSDRSHPRQARGSL